jgi:hypothetical protein
VAKTVPVAGSCVITLNQRTGHHQNWSVWKGLNITRRSTVFGINDDAEIKKLMTNFLKTTRKEQPLTSTAPTSRSKVGK